MHGGQIGDKSSLYFNAFALHIIIIIKFFQDYIINWRINTD